MRYEIQGALLTTTFPSSTIRPTWLSYGSAFTEKGARRVWWRQVNKRTVVPVLYRIYDKKLGKVVEQ